MSTTVYFNGTLSTSGSFLRCRAASNAASLGEIACVENLNAGSNGLGTFLTSGTIATVADCIAPPFPTFEIRQVTAQTSVSFDASTIVRAGPTPFTARNGVIYVDGVSIVDGTINLNLAQPNAGGASNTIGGQIAAAGTNAGGGGGTGNGPYAITYTVTDGINPLQGARVSLAENNSVYSFAPTSSSGTSALSMAAGAYVVAAALAGYSYTPTTLTVSGSAAATLAMTAITPPSNTNAGQATVYAYIYDGSGSLPVCGRRFAMALVSANTGNDVWNSDPFWSGESDSTGLATNTAETGATYKASVDGVHWSSSFTVTGNSFHLGENVGPFRKPR
jgi:hypothetical protein